jgi:PLD-like domain
MPASVFLQRGWTANLKKLLSSAKRDVLISSPFITQEGVLFVHEHLSSKVRNAGGCRLITNLSPNNIVQGATDPRALKFLADRLAGFTVWHLPKLHAKVYIADVTSAIITSANLTRGGPTQNYEYGIHFTEQATVRQIRDEVTAYSDLGACLSPQELSHYVDVSAQVRAAFQRQQRTVSRTAKAQFERLFFRAENDLISLRISGASRTRVFERTIEYLLSRYGAMTTPEIHDRVKSIHPDLCDDTIDRVIAGQHFGKKWKHAVRTAQGHLKAADRIELIGRKWQLRWDAT